MDLFFRWQWEVLRWCGQMHRYQSERLVESRWGWSFHACKVRPDATEASVRWFYCQGPVTHGHHSTRLIVCLFSLSAVHVILTWLFLLMQKHLFLFLKQLLIFNPFFSLSSPVLSPVLSCLVLCPVSCLLSPVPCPLSPVLKISIYWLCMFWSMTASLSWFKLAMCWSKLVII